MPRVTYDPFFSVLCMAVRWTITFKTLSDHTGLVKVYDSSYSGDPIPLEPAVSAFYTTCQQQGFFQPVVDDSGYLRVIDNGVASEHIEDMHPIGAFDRPVEFYLDNVLQWRGYISPESFSVAWESAPREVDFPLVGALSILDSVNIEYNNTEFQSIAAFLKEILTATGFIWDGVTLAEQIAELDSYTTFPEFRFMLARSNFFSFNSTQNIDDPDWTKFVGDTYLQCLQKICTYFGWTASQAGLTLILSNSRLDLTSEGFNKISWADLSALAADNEATVTASAQTRPSKGLFSLDFDGVDHRKSLQNGRKKIIVQTETNESDDMYPRLLFNGSRIISLDSPAFPYTQNREIIGKTRFMSPAKENVLLYCYEWDDNREVFVRSNWIQPTAQNVEKPRADIVAGETYDYSTLVTRPAPENYTKFLRLYLAEKYNNVWHRLSEGSMLATINAAKTVLFSGGGALCISAKVRHNLDIVDGYDEYLDTSGLTQFGPHGGSLKLSVEIGDKYYDGEEWTDTFSTFDVPLDVQGTWDGIIKDNNDGRYDDAVGFVIPIPEDMTGLLSVSFHMAHEDVTNNKVYAVFVHDFSVRYFNNFLKDSENEKGVRIGQLTGQAFKDDLTQVLQISSLSDEQAPVPCSAFLFWDGAPIGKDAIITYCDDDATVLAQPEYWLLDSLKKAYSNPAVWLTLEVSTDPDVTLYSVILDGSRQFLVMSMETDYASEHTKLIIASYE